MLLLALVVAALVAPVLLLLSGHRTAAGVVLVAVLYTRVSDLAVTPHGVGPVDVSGLSLPSQGVLLGLTAIVFMERTWLGRTRTFGDHRGAWSSMALYLAVLAASSIWAIDESAAAGQAVSLVKNLLIVYVVAEVLDTARAQRAAIWAMLAAGGALSALTVAQWWTRDYGNAFLGFAQAPVREVIVGAANQVRASGPIGDPNFYALILAVLVPFALVRLRDEERPSRRLAAAAMTVLLLLAIALTYSRGGLVTVVVGAVAVAALARFRLRTVVVALVAIAAAIPLAPSEYVSRISSIARGDASIANREASQEVAFQLFADHPFLGVGADNYPATYFDTALRLDVPGAADHPHNLYLAVAAETGLLGLVAFLAAMYLALRAVWRRRAEAIAHGERVAEGLASSTLAALLTYLVGVAFLPIAYPRYLWLLVGLGLAVAGTSQQAVRDERRPAGVLVASPS